MLAAVLDTLGVGFEARAPGAAGAAPFLHPGRSAEIVVDGGSGPVGWLGEIHPLVAADWDLDGAVAAFELDLDVVPRAADAAVPAI